METQHDKNRPFSKKWMVASVAIFIGIELLLGGIVGELVVGRFMSLSLRFMLQGLLNLVSFFCRWHYYRCDFPGSSDT